MILERIQGSRFSRVLRAWEGRVAVLLAGGPSLTREQFEIVRVAREADRVRVIAINDSYLLAPWADVCYAADLKWHLWHAQGIDKPNLGLTAAQVRERWARFAGQKCTVQASGGTVPDEAVHVVRNRDHPNLGRGLSLDPEFLVTGRHGGFQALNLASLAGARDHLLLGYDACRGASGQWHWHGDHPSQPPAEGAFQAFRKTFVEAQDAITAAGLRVVNCSPISTITTFEKMPLDEALELVAA